MLSSVPEALKQKFIHLPPGTRESFTDRTFDEEYNVKYLSTNGELSGYLALYLKNELLIYKSSDHTLKTRFHFDHGCVIEDVCYFPDKDDKFGLFLGVNCEEDGIHVESFVSLLHSIGGVLTVIQKIVIPHEITCISVLISEKALLHKSDQLNARMKAWPHILAVGTKFAHCYLLNFSIKERVPTLTSETPVSKTLTDALKPFHHGKQFHYQFDDPSTGRRTRKLDIAAVSVTAFGFIERYNTMIIGLSFGGLMTVCFGPTANIVGLIYGCSSGVAFINYLEPHDDPHNDVWFCVGHHTRTADTTRPGLTMSLYSVSRPPNLENPDDTDLIIALKLLHAFSNGRKWVSMRTLVCEKESRDSPVEETTMHSMSQLSIGEFDRSLLFLAYLNEKNQLLGNIFDLNAYYYKRLVQAVVPDNTKARQNAFMSFIWPCLTNFGEEYQDLVVDTTIIKRLKSNVSDADQLFYPSNYEIRLIHAATGHNFRIFNVPCMGHQTMDAIVQDLESHLEDSLEAAEWLLAVGLASHNEDTPINTLLSCLVNYGYCSSLLNFIRRSSHFTNLCLIRSWMWTEIERAKEKMDETIVPLFNRPAKHLTPQGKKMFSYAKNVFLCGVEVFGDLIPACSNIEACSESFIRELKARRTASYNLLQYSFCVENMCLKGMLPLPNNSNQVWRTMKDQLESRREKARSRRAQLSIDQLVSKMHMLEPSLGFWMGQDASTYYPPALLNLLAPLLVMTISNKLKKELLIYYAIDYITVTDSLRGIVQTKSSICNSANELLDDLYDINVKEIDFVYDQWSEDNGDENCGVSVPLAISDKSTHDDINYWLELPRSLTENEEATLREKLTKEENGFYKWQCYLIKNSRYDEVELATVPKESNDLYAQKYSAALPGVMHIRETLGKRKKDIAYPIKWSSNIMDAINNFDSKSKSPRVESAVLFKPRTPFPLRQNRSFKNDANRKRTFENHERESVVANTLTLTSPMMTPPAKRNLANEDTPDGLNISTEVWKNINDVMKTPTSRARAAAAAEAHLSMDTTPENIKQLPPPTSILKSAAKSKLLQSPCRPRLRFDLPNTTMESVASEHPDVPQPDFDTEDDSIVEISGEQKSEVVEADDSVMVASNDNSSIETDVCSTPSENLQDIAVYQDSGDSSSSSNERAEERDDPIPNIVHNETTTVRSPIHSAEEQSDEDELGEDLDEKLAEIESVSEVQQKSVSVYETEDVTNVEEEEDDEEEVVSSIGDGLNAPKLVDYSINDTTFNISCPKNSVNRWVNETGVNCSMEQQSDDDVVDEDASSAVSATDLKEKASQSELVSLEPSSDSNSTYNTNVVISNIPALEEIISIPQSSDEIPSSREKTPLLEETEATILKDLPMDDSVFSTVSASSDVPVNAQLLKSSALAPIPATTQRASSVVPTTITNAKQQDLDTSESTAVRRLFSDSIITSGESITGTRRARGSALMMSLMNQSQRDTRSTRKRANSEVPVYEPSAKKPDIPETLPEEKETINRRKSLGRSVRKNSTTELAAQVPQSPSRRGRSVPKTVENVDIDFIKSISKDLPETILEEEVKAPKSPSRRGRSVPKTVEKAEDEFTKSVSKDIPETIMEEEVKVPKSPSRRGRSVPKTVEKADDDFVKSVSKDIPETIMEEEVKVPKSPSRRGRSVPKTVEKAEDEFTKSVSKDIPETIMEEEVKVPKSPSRRGRTVLPKRAESEPVHCDPSATLVKNTMCETIPEEADQSTRRRSRSSTRLAMKSDVKPTLIEFESKEPKSPSRRGRSVPQTLQNLEPMSVPTISDILEEEPEDPVARRRSSGRTAQKNLKPIESKEPSSPSRKGRSRIAKKADSEPIQINTEIISSRIANIPDSISEENQAPDLRRRSSGRTTKKIAPTPSPTEIQEPKSSLRRGASVPITLKKVDDTSDTTDKTDANITTTLRRSRSRSVTRTTAKKESSSETLEIESSIAHSRGRRSITSRTPSPVNQTPGKRTRKNATTETPTATPNKRGRKAATTKSPSVEPTPSKRGRTPTVKKAASTTSETPSKKGRTPTVKKAASTTAETPSKRGRKANAVTTDKLHIESTDTLPPLPPSSRKKKTDMAVPTLTRSLSVTESSKTPQKRVRGSSSIPKTNSVGMTEYETELFLAQHSHKVKGRGRAASVASENIVPQESDKTAVPSVARGSSLPKFEEKNE